jgi:hypothetical protein
MIGSKVLFLLIILSLTFSEVALQFPGYNKPSQTSIRVTGDKTMLLIGTAAAVVWFVKGMYNSFIVAAYGFPKSNMSHVYFYNS